MTSLRIGHQSRATGEIKSGDNARTEAPEGAASFAAALGAAGFAPERAAGILTGDQSGGAHGGAPAPRKRDDGHGKADTAAAALAAEGKLAVSAADLPVAAAAPVSGADATTAALVATAAPASGGAATASLAAGSGETQAPVMPRPSAIMSSAAAPAVLPDAAQADLTDMAHNVPSAAPAATTNASAAPAARQTAAVDDPTGERANPVAGLIAPDAITVASNVAQDTVMPPANPNRSQVPPGLVAALSGQGLPIQTGQSSTEGTAGDRSDQRGHFASTIAVPDAGDAVAVAGFGATVQTAAPATASTAPPSAVADPSATSTIADQVAGQLMRLVSSSSREMVMRLHPPELGDLTVRIAVNGRDVTAWFGSPQPQVQAAISEGIGQLQTDLGSAGYNLDGAWVGADASGTRQQGSNPPPLPVPALTPATSLGLSDSPVSRPLASGMSIYV